MHGDQDEIVPIEYGKNAAEEYAQGKLEVFTGEIHGFTENGNRRMEAMALYFVHDVIGIGRKWYKSQEEWITDRIFIDKSGPLFVVYKGRSPVATWYI